MDKSVLEVGSGKYVTYVHIAPVLFKRCVEGRPPAVEVAAKLFLQHFFKTESVGLPKCDKVFNAVTIVISFGPDGVGKGGLSMPTPMRMSGSHSLRSPCNTVSTPNDTVGSRPTI